MRSLPLYVLFLCSGAAGLICELVWVRELIFVFGGTTYAVTTVLAAFMAGLGLGSYIAGRWCYRLARPGRVYGLLEIGIGVYALIVPLLLKMAVPLYRALYTPLADWPWVLNLVRFGIGGLMLLVPTMCMGASLPVLVRYVALQGRALGRAVGQLYGINTFGAVLGTLGAGFALIPSLGLLRTTWTAAAINIVIGIAAIKLLQHPLTTDAAEPAPTPPPPPATRLPAGSWVRRSVLVAFAVSGFAAMVYQITWTRTLIMSVGSTTYAFTCILAAFILGLALGSLAVARWVDRWKSAVSAFGVFELLIGLVAVVIVPIHGRIPLVVESLVNKHYADFNALLWLQFLLIIAITIVPTFLMGAIFPLAIRALARAGEEPGAVTGRAYLVNTLGAIAGAFLAGFVLIRSDTLGVQNSIILASVLNGLAGLALVIIARPATPGARVRRAVLPAVTVLLILGVGLGSGRWDQQLITSAPFMMRGASSSPRDILFYREGVDATVSVERPKGAPLMMTLRINGTPDASTVMSDMMTQILLGHVPALLHPGARSACLVGLGSGVSLAALACHRSFERLDCAEISAEVIAAAAQFAPFTYNILERDPRVHVIRADGRNHLVLTDQMYDLIITAPSNPWMAGVASLFTREFFELSKRRLRDDGLLAVWLPASPSSVADFQMVIRTLFDVFDHVSLWELGERDFLLVASRQPLKISYEDFVRRFRVPTVRADLYRLSVRWPVDVLARYVACDQPLREWAAGAPVNTDDNARLEFSAPRHMYESQTQIAQALVPLQRPVMNDLLADADLPPNLGAELDNALAARLAPVRAQILLAATPASLANHVAALQIVLEARMRCPYDAELFQYAVLLRRSYEAAPDVARRPEIAPLLAQLAQVGPPPPGARINGTSLTEIAADLRTAAQSAAQQGQWPEAASLLSEAHDLEPENLDTMRLLADALARLGQSAAAAALLDEVLQRRPDDGLASRARALLAIAAHDNATAVRVLGIAVKWGALMPEELAGDEALRVLQAEPGFQALLSSPRSATTPATSRPQ